MSAASRVCANGFPSSETKKRFKPGFSVKLKNRRVELYHDDEKYLIVFKKNIDGAFKMVITELVVTPEALHALVHLAFKLNGPEPKVGGGNGI